MTFKTGNDALESSFQKLNITPQMNTFMRFAADWVSLVTSFPVKMKRLLVGYGVLNLEVASFSSFRYFLKRSFCYGEVGAEWWREGDWHLNG